MGQFQQRQKKNFRSWILEVIKRENIFTLELDVSKTFNADLEISILLVKTLKETDKHFSVKMSKEIKMDLLKAEIC